ncbi:Octaprenyl-diphosphate synthase [Pseudobythopirellula maris]|uniref:Octaprenyl-diphosphate synthase n=1 Tax=Pseudobythopirellula maris TaxID=2527991 RepID=A0A5C5ZQM4_9BACT|nr:polyprenyl synthetase family protein [Pseudobythopirellula maris]TWT88593.1 Octaprenyl-diphosphate synthase [Pseudobythopirellula maris]
MTTPAAHTIESARSASAATLAELFAPIAEALGRVESRLQTELRAGDGRLATEEVDRVVRHGYRLGGKRLRPALVLLSARAAGEACDDHVLLGVVVEMIHTATLVHDDVLDEATLRRHVQTVNARWGNETSVLLGDFLFSKAFYLASTLPTVDACRVIGASTERVCLGELRQTLSEGDLELDEEDYLAIVEAKTAELCACCCSLGARYAGASTEAIDALTAFGRDLGVAFQIADDLLDLTGEEAATGKTVGADLAKRKMTLPLIHARRELVDGPRLAFDELLRKGDGASRSEALRIAEETGGLAYAQEQAEAYAARAAERLEVLAEGPDREALAMVAQFSSRRRA